MYSQYHSWTTVVSLGDQGAYNGLYSGFSPNLFKQVLEVTVHDGDCDGGAVYPRLFAKASRRTHRLFAFVNEYQAAPRSETLTSSDIR